MLEEQWREEETLDVYHTQQRDAMKLLLIRPATWQDLSVSTVALLVANLVVETILVEDETQWLMALAALVVYLLRLSMRSMLEALTAAVYQALMLDNLELEVAK